MQTYPGGEIPKTGTATYNGTLRGDTVNGNTIERNAISGNITLNTNFGSQAMSGNLSVTHNGSAWASATFGQGRYPVIKGRSVLDEPSYLQDLLNNSKEISFVNGSLSRLLKLTNEQDSAGIVETRYFNKNLRGAFASKNMDGLLLCKRCVMNEIPDPKPICRICIKSWSRHRFYCICTSINNDWLIFFMENKKTANSLFNLIPLNHLIFLF